jgi:YegS/Rv2252/BmrU family lipid kinase
VLAEPVPQRRIVDHEEVVALKVHVVINPAAGKPDTILNTLNSVFHPAGVTWDVTVTHKSGDATKAAHVAAEGGADVVASYGGDGTAMEVAQGLLGTETLLAVLPGGTANVMSQELGISRKLVQAAEVIVAEDSRVREVDLGRIGERLFILRALAGFGAARQIIVDRPMKDKYGMLAYQIGFLKALRDAQSFECRLTLDGQVMEKPAVAIEIYNSANMGIQGVSMVPAEVDDGYLDVLAIGDIDTLQIASVAEALRRGSTESEHFIYRRARSVRVECDPPQPVVADGEDIGTTPLEVEIVPAAVRILSPKEE